MKNYLIVGASSGIGKSLANILAKDGHNVFGTYFSHETVSSLPNLSFNHLDTSSENPNFDFLPEDLDGFVFCPGSINLKPFGRIKPSEFMEDFNLQVIGAIKTLQHLIPRLKKSESASVVLFSTIAVQTGFRFHAQVSTSKGAIEGLSKALAAEFAPKIRFNCIAPSLTDTPLAEKLLNSEEKRKANAQRHPLQTIGQAEDIAEMAKFLLSQKSKWITGQVLHVDGGLSSLNA